MLPDQSKRNERIWTHPLAWKPVRVEAGRSRGARILHELIAEQLASTRATEDSDLHDTSFVGERYRARSLAIRSSTVGVKTASPRARPRPSSPFPTRGPHRWTYWSTH